MDTVWKYPIPLDKADFELEMPFGAKLLCLGPQAEGMMMWAQVDPNAAQTTRVFKIVGTGQQEIPENAVYIDTFGAVNMGVQFVFHLFELR